MRSMRLQQLIESRHESLATKKEAQKKPMFAWELDFLYETLYSLPLPARQGTSSQYQYCYLDLVI